ncbi:MAG: velvet protein [Icmadophila ericetorum]|nr:velvet protein [Icmadophila ericetorum]
MASIIAVNNETESVMTRVTKDGRKLTYEMKVLQQPKRARACGSGAKSSADRRPVDPPPVVELRILEGDAKNDITFSHNANFFLYTTLESARPIAQGRANALPAPFPVLTGMPVAGMAYLDRPSPAGYFIFPDLSVRHEGKYRLSFNLFEELKEAKDADAEPAISNPDHPNNKLLRSSPMAPQAHVHFRLEVKSEPFVVFSAKKFPGLAESTALSRVVAEQGCRVRIRRDVRMRRRDTKASKDYEDYDDEATYSRPDRYTTPDMYAQQQASSDRARSISNASIDGQAPYNNMEQRRPSVHDMGYYQAPSYQQPAPPTVSQPATNSYPPHLSFGGSVAPQYQAPAMLASVASNPHPAQNYLSNGNGYQYQQGPHQRQMSNPQNYGYNANTSYQQPQYQNSQAYAENTEYRPTSDFRRGSLPPSTPTYPSQVVNSYPPVDNRAPYVQTNYYPQQVPAAAPAPVTPSDSQILPPLKTLQPPPEKKYEAAMPVSVIPGPVATATYSSSYETSPVPRTLISSNSGRLGKRAFGKVFDTGHLNQPVHGGMRPELATHGQDIAQIQLDDGTLVDEEEDGLPNLKLLSYRRADGSRQHKKCPSPITG